MMRAGTRTGTYRANWHGYSLRGRDKRYPGSGNRYTSLDYAHLVRSGGSYEPDDTGAECDGIETLPDVAARYKWSVLAAIMKSFL